MRFSHRRQDAEIDRAREMLLILVCAFRDRLEENTRSVGWLRDELQVVRREIRELPRGFDARIASDALGLLGDAHKQIGIQQQQIALLSDSETLIELAGTAAAVGFEDLLRDPAQEGQTNG